MVVDDDDVQTSRQAGNEQVGEKTAETPTEPPEGDEQPEGEQETVADADEDIGEVDEPKDDDDEGDEGDEGDEEKKPRRRDGLARLKEQRDRLRSENEALRARTSESLPSDAEQLQRAIEYKALQEVGPEPNPADYRTRDGEVDYVTFSQARQAWETDLRLTRRQVRVEFKRAIAQEQERVVNLVSDHKERESRFKSKVKDYDEVMAKATLPVAPHVERLLLESKRSERLGYHLAKDQTKLARLNRMNLEAAAREIGRLEGRLSLPQQPKTQTQARKPITPLRGSGATPPSPTQAVNAYIKKLYGDSA